MKLIATLLICTFAAAAARDPVPQPPPISTPYDPAHPCTVPDNSTLTGKEHPCIAPDLTNPKPVNPHRVKHALSVFAYGALCTLIVIGWIYAQGAK